MKRNGKCIFIKGRRQNKQKKETMLMRDTKNKASIAAIKTGYFVCFGAVMGAVLGLVAYVKDWL